MTLLTRTQYGDLDFYPPVNDKRTSILWPRQLLLPNDTRQIHTVEDAPTHTLVSSEIRYQLMSLGLPPQGMTAHLPAILIGIHIPGLTDEQRLATLPSIVRDEETNLAKNIGDVGINATFPLRIAAELDGLLAALYHNNRGVDAPITLAYRLTGQGVFNFMILHPEIHTREYRARLLEYRDDSFSPLQHIMLDAVEAQRHLLANR